MGSRRGLQPRSVQILRCAPPCSRKPFYESFHTNQVAHLSPRPHCPKPQATRFRLPMLIRKIKTEECVEMEHRSPHCTHRKRSLWNSRCYSFTSEARTTYAYNLKKRENAVTSRHQCTGTMFLSSSTRPSDRRHPARLTCDMIPRADKVEHNCVRKLYSKSPIIYNICFMRQLLALHTTQASPDTVTDTRHILTTNSVAPPE